jgi:hypothetical protein
MLFHYDDDGTDADYGLVPARIFRRADLPIDRWIKERFREGGVIRQEMSEAVALDFGRCTLETAIRKACIGQEAAREDAEAIEHLNEWQRSHEMAALAHVHLIGALEALFPSEDGNGRRRPRDYVSPLEQHRLDRIPIKSNASLNARKARTRRDVATLIQAREILRKMSADAERRHRHFKAQRRNHGAPEKREFVYCMAEGWTFLTGKRPSGTDIDSRNPFLCFTAEAWVSWKGGIADDLFEHHKEFFTAHLRAAVKRLKIEGREETISRKGPDWLMPH